MSRTAVSGSPRAHRWTTAGLVLALATTLAACSQEEPVQPAPTVTVTPDIAVAKAAPPAPAVPVTWPLTGVETGAVENRPALAVKIENSAAARPQTGLEQADIVWEEVVEGGITRFVAVYHSQAPEIVEPVRSVRPMDPAIVAPLRGILAYSGAQQPFIDAVNGAGIQSVIMDKGHDGFRRDRRRAAPHNVIGTMAAFWAQADGNRAVPPPAQFRYAFDVGRGSAAAGTPANRLDVALSRAQRTVWDWDGASGTYLRSEGSAPSVSTAGVRLSARNVLLLSVNVVNTPYRDPSGAPVPEAQLAGSSGAGVLASGGKSVPVSWSKGGVGDVLVVTLGDGSQAKLDPGSTWVELVPAGSGSWTIG